MSVVEELSGDGSRIVTSWKRTTVADGDWLQHNTIGPLNERDVFLAEKIDELSGNADEKLNEEIAARIAGDEQLYDELSTVSSDFYSFSADVETSAYTLSAAITAEADVRKRVDEDLLGKIEQLQNATDVVDVVGTHEALLAYNEPLTKNDVVKVLVDETKNNLEYYWRVVGDEPQKPYQWTEVGTITPYYSKSEIDDKETELSSTIANTYLSANGTDISAGKNLDVVIQSNNPRVAFKTKDDVSFSSVSAKGFSGTNLSGLNQNDTIDNLFGSAYSGAEASAWINDNSARLDIQAGYGLDVGINDENHLSIGMKQYHCTAGGYDDYSLALGYQSQATAGVRGKASFAFGWNAKAIGAEAFAVGYNSIANASWTYTMGNSVYAAQPYSVVLGFLNSANASGTYQLGRGLSSDNGGVVLGQWNEPVAGATLIVGDGTGTQIGFDEQRKNALIIKDGLVSGRDFSAGDVSLSSLTNISALGNGITNTATFNLSAVKLSAGQGIGFKNDTNGVLSITAEGTTYNAGTYISTASKTISVTGDLIGSAQSGKQAYDTVKNSATLSAGFGIQFTSAATTAMGIKLEATINSDDKIASIGGKELVGGGISSISVPGAVFTGLNVNFSAGDNIDFTTANNKLTIDLNDNIFLNGGESQSKQIYLITKDEDEIVIGSDGPEIAILNTTQSQLHLYNNKISRGTLHTTWDKVINAGNSIPIVVGSTGTDLNTLYIY